MAREACMNPPRQSRIVTGSQAHLEWRRGTHARSKSPKARAQPVVSQGAMMHVKEMPVAYAASSTTTVKT